MIDITCLCGYTGQVPDKFAGKKVKCRECSSVIPVPDKEDDAPVDPATAVANDVAPPPPPPDDPPPEPAPAPSFNFDDDTTPTKNKKPRKVKDDDDDDPEPVRPSGMLWGLLGSTLAILGLVGGFLFWFLGSQHGTSEADICRDWLLKRAPAADVASITFQGNVSKGVAEGVALTKQKNPSVMPTVAKLPPGCFSTTTKMYGITYTLDGKHHEDMLYVADNQVLGGIDAKVCSDELQAGLQYLNREAAKKTKAKSK